MFHFFDVIQNLSRWLLCLILYCSIHPLKNKQLLYELSHPTKIPSSQNVWKIPRAMAIIGCRVFSQTLQIWSKWPVAIPKVFAIIQNWSLETWKIGDPTGLVLMWECVFFSWEIVMFFLGGGFKKSCYFHHDPWVNDLILLIIFQWG